MDYIYDIETFASCFTFCAISVDNENDVVLFECSTRKNEAGAMFQWLDERRDRKDRMVGFNNIGFDYPVLHDLLSVREKALTVSGKAVAVRAYKKAQQLIEVGDEEKFAHIIKTSDEHVQQIDLYKIHHFDNKARRTSLKALEFNMLSDTIEDLPYSPHEALSSEQIDKLIAYNIHDVKNTLKFYVKSLGMITFREELTKRYGRNFLNSNDTAIGKSYFVMRLEEAMPGSCYSYKGGKRTVMQTKRNVIKLKDCLFDYYDFKRPEFIAIHQWLLNQRIKETKGVFTEIDESELGDVAKYAQMYTKRKKFKAEPSDADIDAFKQQHPLGWVEKTELKAKKKGETQYSYWMCWNEADCLNVVINGFRFDFGTGGIHGSLTDTIIEETDEIAIVDGDVSSFYPNLAIVNRIYPEHLSEKFCDIYKDVYDQRKSFPKGSAENAMLKLALNGVYGDSNNKFSPFYDPQYTMKITLNGELTLCLLVDRLLDVKGLKVVNINTDGVTTMFPKKYRRWYDNICRKWQEDTGLALEFAEYSKMCIKSVNDYIAVYKE